MDSKVKPHENLELWQDIMQIREDLMLLKCYWDLSDKSKGLIKNMTDCIDEITELEFDRLGENSGD